MSISRALRVDAYKNRNVQLLLNKFLSGELSNLSPVYDPKHGYRYPVIEEIVNSPSNTDEFLNFLFDVGILKRDLHDRVVFCPHCHSANFSIHYCCPYCTSFNIKKSSLVEHVKCGYMDVEERFQVKDKYVCPRCGDELIKPDADYRKAGVWYTCNECGKNFDIPSPRHFCRDCYQNFMFEDAPYKDVYSYSLSEDAVQELKLEWLMIDPVRKFLQDRGFKVESPGFLKGASGTNHVFDIVASFKSMNRGVIAIDFAAADSVVSKEAVIMMFAKIYDARPSEAYFIVTPKLDEEGRKLASLYNIKVIEAKDPKEAIKALKACIKE